MYYLPKSKYWRLHACVHRQQLLLHLQSVCLTVSQYVWVCVPGLFCVCPLLLLCPASSWLMISTPTGSAGSRPPTFDPPTGRVPHTHTQPHTQGPAHWETDGFRTTGVSSPFSLQLPVSHYQYVHIQYPEMHFDTRDHTDQLLNIF